MKSRWLSAVVLAVALGVSACGGTQEASEPEMVSQPGDEGLQSGNVEQMLPMCDAQGRCPVGYYCDGGTCRRQVIELLPQCDDLGQCPVGFYCVGGPYGTCRPGDIEAQ